MRSPLEFFQRLWRNAWNLNIDVISFTFDFLFLILSFAGIVTIVVGELVGIIYLKFLVNARIGRLKFIALLTIVILSQL